MNRKFAFTGDRNLCKLINVSLFTVTSDPFNSSLLENINFLHKNKSY